MKSYITLGLVALVMAGRCIAAPFVNLDFEAGDTTRGALVVRPDGSSVGRIEDWLPGWRVFAGEGEQNGVQLNSALGVVNSSTLFDVQYPWTDLPRDGKLGFIAVRSLPSVLTSLRQIGQIPTDAKSFRYKAQGGSWEVSINGMSLDPHGWNPKDTSYAFQEVAVDVSPWAGQEVELKLTQSMGYNYSLIDSMRFSTEVIPEPRQRSMLFLGAGTMGALAWMRARGRKTLAGRSVTRHVQ